MIVITLMFFALAAICFGVFTLEAFVMAAKSDGYHYPRSICISCEVRWLVLL
jgi:hypothetical protein